MVDMDPLIMLECECDVCDRELAFILRRRQSTGRYSGDDQIHCWMLVMASCGSVGTLSPQVMGECVSECECGTNDVRELRHPTAVAVDKKPRLVRLAGLLSFATHLALGILHCRLCVGRGLHVLGLYRLR